MSEIDFMYSLHNSTKRDYLARVNDIEYPKARAAELAKSLIMIIGMAIGEFVMEGINTFLEDGRVLPEKCRKGINCQMMRNLRCWMCKGYLLYDFLKVLPNSKVFGIDKIFLCN